MKRVALLGFPISHSVSPLMHNAAFSALKLPWHYEALETSSADLPQVVDKLRHEDWVGANVTVPHKVDIIDLLDEVTPPSDEIGAVNTIVNEGGHLKGYNTDLPGFLIDLHAKGVETTGRSTLILGSGGAARAVAFALANQETQLRIICRYEQRGQNIAKDLRRRQHSDISIFAWNEESFNIAAQDCVLIVNATPLGMSPCAGISPWPADISLPAGTFVYDLVYNPPVTRFVKEAQAAGLPACGGLGMLVEQGALTFEIWTGLEPPRQVMHAAAQSALESQHA